MNRIKFLREELNLTQQELANKLNGAKSTVAMYENETRKPSLEILIKLSEIFNCSIDYILCKTDIRERNQTLTEPFGINQIVFNLKDYNPPTEIQKEQIKSLIEIILKDNKKKK